MLTWSLGPANGHSAMRCNFPIEWHLGLRLSLQTPPQRSQLRTIMANVLHPQIEFHHGPAAPNLGFGFGMSTAAVKGGWQQHTLSPGHNNSAVFQQLASNISQPSPSRLQKRRHDPEDDENFGGHSRHTLSHASTAGLRDDAMDRSPTPERPKRAPPKRARVMNATDSGNKEKSKESKPSGSEEDGDVDVGVLLGELIGQTLHFDED